MKKLLIGAVLLSVLGGCSEEADNQTPAPAQVGFETILKSKEWVITKYEFQDYLNPHFGLRNFYNDSVFTRQSQIQPDPCNWSGTTTSPLGIWKSYEAKFTETNMLGTFAYHMRKVNWDPQVTNESTCTIGYTLTTHLDHITKPWTYNANTNVLTTSFGEPYEILDGQEEFFEMKYNVVSYSPSKIVLEGKRYYQAPNDTVSTLFLVNNVVLE